MIKPLKSTLSSAFSLTHTPGAWQIRFYLLVGLSLLIVLSTFTEYGITIDEPPQSVYGEAIFKWYFNEISDSEFFDRIKAIDLERYGGLFDTSVYAITQILPLDPFETRHLCNALVGLLGVYLVYRLGVLLASPAIGCLAALFLILTPRYYGHSFNNPKDIPFAVFYILSLYCLIKCLNELPRLSGRQIWKTGLSVGLALSVRVGGLVIFGYVGLAFALRYIQIAFTQHPSWQARLHLVRQFLGQVISLVFIAWIPMLVFWPKVQLEPFTYPFHTLQFFSDFTRHNTTFFEGQHLTSVDVPWYYAPKWFLLIAPEFLLLGLAAGLSVILFDLLRKRRHALFNLQWFILHFGALFPLAYVAIKAAPLYDGFRHFLFVLPPLSIAAAAGIYRAVEALPSINQKRGFIGLTGLLMGLTLFDMVSLHPNEYIYFNRLIAGGLNRSAKQYQTDYWENSYKQGIQWLEAHHIPRFPDRNWRIGAGSDNVQYYLGSDRYEIVPVPDDVDLYLSTIRDDRHRLVPGEFLHIVERDRVPLFYIIRPDSSYQDNPFFLDPGGRYTVLAWKYFKFGQHEKAIDAYQKALAYDPDNALIYNNISGNYLQLGHYKEAETYAQKALQWMPRHVTAWGNLGRALQAQNKLTEAALAYRRGTEHAPQNLKMHLGLARIYHMRAQTDSGSAAYQRVLSLNPQQVEARDGLQTMKTLAFLLEAARTSYQLGDQHLQKNDAQAAGQAYTHALVQCKQVLEQAPQSAKAYILAGMILQKVGEKSRARYAYQNALKYEPDDSSIQALLKTVDP